MCTAGRFAAIPTSLQNVAIASLTPASLLKPLLAPTMR